MSHFLSSHVYFFETTPGNEPKFLNPKRSKILPLDHVVFNNACQLSRQRISF